MTAERAGPLVGGLVATLPIGAGPVYVFLALDHDAQFIAQSAINSLAINMVNVIFALIYALLAQKRSLAVSLSVALLVWIALALGHARVHWTLLSPRLAMNVVVLALCLVLARPLRHVTDAAGAHAIGTIWRCARRWWRRWSASTLRSASASAPAAAASWRCSRSS